jgi:hypothetical protein
MTPPALRFASLALVLAVTSAARADLASLERSFATPPDEAKIMVRWWWFGPAVTTPQLEREMKLMKAGGIGGFEVQPTYPLALDGEIPGLKNLKFLSPEFLDALKFTGAKAKELGLRFNLTLGSGWPYGGPMFSINEAAGRLRSQSADAAAGATSVPAPALRDGEKLVAAYLTAAPASFKEIEIRDSAAQLPAGVTAPAKVLFFIAGHTGMMVKRPAFGAEGYVIDHYDPAVVNKFIKEIAEPELKAFGGNIPYSVFCDSLEVGGEDWTMNFFAEFQKRRGYDLRPLLPALTSDAGEKTRDIRHDWGRTLTELFDDHFVTPLQKWSQANHTRFRIQAYGTPPAALFSYAYADLPEGEGYTWKTYRDSRVAASASHLLGRPVTSSETWTWLHSPVFRATPLDMKAEADLHFLQGINQLIAHGWPYTAEGVEYPGWRFYASAVFNEKNPWWIVMPDVTAYLQRVSHILRQGQPANDIALYLADSDAWASFVPGRVAMNAAVSQALGRDITRQILESGYNYDFIDDGMLELRGRVDGGALAFGDVRYKTVVLAGVERIPVTTMRTLEKFAQAGGLVVATRRLPALAPGYATPESDTQEVTAIAARLFKAPGAPGLFVENETQLGELLAKRTPPDVALAPAAPDIGFVHRHTDGGEVYFLANTGNTPHAAQATFRVEGAQAEWWDPMTGRVTAAEISARPAGGSTVALDLEPYGSRVLVFTKRQLPAHAEAKLASAPALDLSTGWTVTFGKEPKPVAMEKLASWTDSDATKNFSGTATYIKTFEASADLRAAGRLELNFGEGKPITPTGRGAARFQAMFEGPVREAAVVYVNGRRAGSLWHPPYAVDVTGLLITGKNQLYIEVANLAVNYMAGHPLPDYKALTAKYGERFQAQDMNLIAPVPAGLLGPIQLLASDAAK